MICPKCDSSMEVLNVEGTEVNKCTGCKGLWFHELEHEILKEVKGSESIDSGDAKEGILRNKIDDYKCPSWGGNMVRLVDNEQPHIWYEVYHSCFGVFFDAGEFRDYKDRSLVDIIASFVVGERK